jgi:hypothetical protein
MGIHTRKQLSPDSALTAAGGPKQIGQDPTLDLGTNHPLTHTPTSAPQPVPRPATRTQHQPITVGTRRPFGHQLGSDGTATGLHGEVSPLATSSAVRTAYPFSVPLNTFRLAPQPWDSQYVQGMTVEAEH